MSHCGNRTMLRESLMSRSLVKGCRTGAGFFCITCQTLRRRLQQAVILSMLQNFGFPQAELATSSNALGSGCHRRPQAQQLQFCWSTFFLPNSSLLICFFSASFHSGIPAFFITSIQPLGSLRIHPWKYHEMTLKQIWHQHKNIHPDLALTDRWISPG